MLEVTGNLWDFKVHNMCITTNGFVKKDGRAVMGAGCAKEAVDKYKLWDLPLSLGTLIKDNGNIFQRMHVGNPHSLWAFPVKHNWWEKADTKLIERSCKQLAEYVAKTGYRFILPRPGCGNGGLDWEQDVKPICQQYLGDRIMVVTFAGTG